MCVCSKTFKTVVVSNCVCQVNVRRFNNNAVSGTDNFSHELSGNIFCQFAK